MRIDSAGMTIVVVVVVTVVFGILTVGIGGTLLVVAMLVVLGMIGNTLKDLL